jgi:hypothetical protein
MRSAIGVFAAIALAFTGIFLIELVGRIFWPPPAGVDLYDPEQVAAMMPVMPLGAKLMIVLGWFIGSLAGGVGGLLIARRRWVGYVGPLFVALASIINILVIPHPLWMQIAAVAAPLLAAVVVANMPVLEAAERQEGVDDRKI